jgi:hypothetical protein
MITTARIRVLDANQLFEDRVCRLVRLRGGQRAAIWRGLAYPLSEDDTIDISGVGVSPSECLPVDTSAGSTGAGRRWSVVEGLEEAWVLVAGTVADRDAAALGLRQAGLTVLRSGAWLGEVADGLQADWFVRIVQPTSAKALKPLLEQILGPRQVAGSASTEPADDLRRRLMGAELDRARAEAAALRAEAERLNAGAGNASALAVRVVALEAELEHVQRALEAERAARTAPADTSQPSAALPAAQPPRLARRLQEEVATVLESLLPGVRLLRDSLMVASAEFRDRAAFYRALRELAQGPARLPPAWKKLRGADGWWERHVSTGEDDAGRAYVRTNAASSGWDVLLSHKAEQARDIEWLRSLR